MLRLIFPAFHWRSLQRAAPAFVCACLVVWLSLPEAEARRLPLVDLGGPPRANLVRTARVFTRNLAVADRLLVGVRPGVGTASATSRALNTYGGRVSRALGGGRILVVDLPPGSDILTVARKLEGQSGIEFAEPDWVVETAAIPTDPEYAKQTHLPQIRCPEAWDIGTGSRQVIIAVIDTGIDLNHPDLADRIWVNPGEIPGNRRDDDRNGYVDDVHGWNFYDENNDVRAVPDGIDQNGDGEPDEQVSHGTLVAGLAAAAANGWGTVGAAWHATIMPLKIFPDDGGTYVDVVIEAMYYAIQNGAHIINLSIGAPWNRAFTPPIEEIWARGGLTVCAAGNGATRITDSETTWSSPVCNNGPDPLSDNMVLGVGGVDSTDRLASWSNWDESTRKTFVDVYAPGVNLLGPGVYYPSVAGFDSYFTRNSGTSFSAPLVSGVAAMLKAQDMTRTGADLMRLIRTGSDNIDRYIPGNPSEMGVGRLNAARSMGGVLPPRPPTNVHAGDRTGDEGGAIRVLWTKSGDDGGGNMSVTGYIVSRGTGALPHPNSDSSWWTDIATLPAGAEEYIDATTTDGVDYYYRVAAIAPGFRMESDPYGPVQSRDDNPPPPVNTLTATDRPADSGGAIVLDWTGYIPPPDLVSFRVYRSDRPFVSVRTRTPLATITDPTARTFTDSTTVDGTDYYYAVTGVDDVGNEGWRVTCVGPVQSFSNGPVEFRAGLHMLAAPIIPADHHPATLLGLSPSSLRYARYDTAAAAYRTYTGEPLADILRLELGRGFWVRLDSPVRISPVGSLAPAGDLTLNVSRGWNQLGNPYLGSLSFGSITVIRNGNTMDLASAEATGVLRAYAWIYDSALGDYVLVHSRLGDRHAIKPWEGFWLLVDQACQVTLPRPTAANSAELGPASSSVRRPEGEWPVQLVLSTATGQDRANYFGVSALPSHVVSPPPISDRAELSFVSTDGAGQPLATLFESAAKPNMTWPFEVRWGAPQGTAALMWPDLSSVPAAYSLTLHDLDTGRRVSMRHQRQYTVDCSSPHGRRRFQIEARRTAATCAQITSLSARSTGTGAEIVFTLSQDAACEIAVLNIAGRTIRVLETDRLRPAGANVALWDMRNGTGAKVPPGTYLVRITARSEEGSLTSALRNMQVSR